MRRPAPLPLLALAAALAASLASSPAPLTYEGVDRAEVGPFAISDEVDDRSWAFDVIIDADEALLGDQTFWSFGLALDLTNQEGGAADLWLFQLPGPWDGQGVPADAASLATFGLAPAAPGAAVSVSTELDLRFAGDALHMILHLDGDTAVAGSGEVQISAWSYEEALPEDASFTVSVAPGG